MSVYRSAGALARHRMTSVSSAPPSAGSSTDGGGAVSYRCIAIMVSGDFDTNGARPTSMR